MTAEAVVLNKSAVAMAADSAVTISRGRSRSKTYDTANKLFELVKGKPVGIMVYSSAEMNGVPWETIIKVYRSERATFVGMSLEEYVDDFLNFLNMSNSFLFSVESEEIAFDRVANDLFMAIVERFIEDISSCLTKTGKLIQTRITKRLNETISEISKGVESRRDGAWTGLTEVLIKQKYGERLTRLIVETFSPDFKLTTSQVKRLEKLVITASRKEAPEDSSSGVVIAGYGEHDPFPSIYAIQVCDRLSGVTRATKRPPVVIGHQNPGAYRTFAQDEMASQFVTGINHRTRREIVSYWSKWIRQASKDLAKDIKEENPRLSNKTVKSITESFLKLSKSGQSDFLSHMNNHQNETFIEPLVSSIAFLPKDELAHMAETLVNLTSVIQRFSIDRDETVGGEIDVVLISKGDGLVWLKRKHYFSLDLNPTWPVTHI